MAIVRYETSMEKNKGKENARYGRYKELKIQGAQNARNVKYS